ncbi:carbohydrate ABC transporter permease [Mesobacillus stamsii]|uniref:Multiple sugar transport system permease protein n=1 Tax=Mesobacillus stamsii TaxID=225347 RepID=A0ABU0FZ30_9BACI|nr:sugar ABC transporter permease [Mesobacillus stamsii]MDQ0415080.1 multiple sugar transport system permease protein [Mesobacillus stamsii]
MEAITDKPQTKKRKKPNLWPILFVGPHLLLFLIFFLAPSIFGIYISFTKWNLFTSPEFVGMDNFRTILFDENSSFYDQFYTGMKNTFIFVLISVPFSIIVPLLIATALSVKPRLNRLFQSLFYLPSLFAISAVMIVWNFLLSVTYGPLENYFGISTNMLDNQPYAWISLVLVTIWWTIGGNMVIYLAALNGVPKDLIEAAELDGAGIFNKFFRVTLPSIKYQILFTTVMTTIAQFNVYGQPLMLTGGGPNNSTEVLLMYIQRNAFGSGMSIAGISSAMAVMLGICIMIVSAIQFFLLRDRD